MLPRAEAQNQYVIISDDDPIYLDALVSSEIEPSLRLFSREETGEAKCRKLSESPRYEFWPVQSPRKNLMNKRVELWNLKYKQFTRLRAREKERWLSTNDDVNGKCQELRGEKVYASAESQIEAEVEKSSETVHTALSGLFESKEIQNRQEDEVVDDPNALIDAIWAIDNITLKNPSLHKIRGFPVSSEVGSKAGDTTCNSNDVSHEVEYQEASCGRASCGNETEQALKGSEFDSQNSIGADKDLLASIYCIDNYVG